MKMEREEIEQFVRQVINADVTWDGEYSCTDETVQAIADRWEADVEDAIAEAGEVTDADACDGPCCTGIIAPTYSEVDCD